MGAEHGKQRGNHPDEDDAERRLGKCGERPALAGLLARSSQRDSDHEGAQEQMHQAHRDVSASGERSNGGMRLRIARGLLHAPGCHGPSVSAVGTVAETVDVTASRCNRRSLACAQSPNSARTWSRISTYSGRSQKKRSFCPITVSSSGSGSSTNVMKLSAKSSTTLVAA